MDDLITWLRAQLDDDEKAASAVFRDHTWSAYLEGGDDGWAVEGAHSGEPSCTVGDEAMAAHIARWDPARVLREVEAKRRLLTLHETVPVAPGKADTTCAECGMAFNAPCPTLRLLALPFSDRPGYREEWRP